MPLGSLSCDPKDFFKERKHERSSESLPRWRESPHHGPHRWGSADFRRPPGHGKQGGWHTFEDSRSVDKILDDEGWRPRGDGKYGRNNRENRGPFSQRGCKGSSWDNGASPNGPGRPAEVNDQRSVDDDMLMYNSHPHSDSWDQFQLKDQNDKIGSASGTVTGQRFDRENSMGSIDWKPLKWTRSGSLSSRGSSFSHSSSSKSIGMDSSEMKAEAQQPRNLTPVQSPSGDAAACVTSAAPADEMNSRKKPRLGWGEGLAKYEKKRVEGPDEIAAKNGMVTCGGNTESLHCHIPQVADKSPRVACYTECSSPATPSSVACSSSPGLEDKTSAKAANADTGNSNLTISPRPVPQDVSEVLPFNLENLDAAPVLNLSSSLNELLKSDDPSSNDSSFVRSTAMNKLLLWKANISKALEVTESEIDLLENELKTLNSESGNTCPRPATSSSLPAGSNLISRPASLKFFSSGDMIMEKTLSQERENAEGKDEDIDSPGTATSKFVEPHSMVKHGDCSSGNVDIRPEILGEKFCADVSGGKALVASNNCTIISSDVGVTSDRDSLYDLIFTANKGCARRASEVFSKLLPSGNISMVVSGTCWKRDDPLVKEKFARRKYFLRFKERVMTLKFRAFQHLWKEDLRLLSIRRRTAKSQKRFELSSRNVHSGNQKHRSSIRSRFSSPAGNLSLVPTTEIINFTSKLLSDSQVQTYRSSLKMPSLILDKKEKIISRFISKNGLVEDPFTVEKERCMINPWTLEEKRIFMDKFAEYGKDFRKIANFLDHKTTADCVEFYYKNHKSDCFPKTKKKPDFLKQGKSYSSSTYLVTSGKRWNHEANAASSLDMLGEASAIAANADVSTENHKRTSRFFFGASNDYKTPRVEDSTSLDFFGTSERETVAADVLAGICGSLSSEAMSSCITSSVDPTEAYQRVPDVSQIIDEETCSDESCGEMMDPSDWTDEEKSIFVQAVSSYGKDFRMISRCVRTRSTDQCKIFFSKARKCLGLDTVGPGPGNEETRMSDDVNGGGSDTEDACVVETGSIVCSEKVVDEANNDESGPERTMELYPDVNQTEENNGVGEMEFKDTELKSEILVSDDCDGDRSSLAVGIGEDSVIKAGESEASGSESMEETISAGDGNDHNPPAVSAAENSVVGPVFDEYSRAEMVGHDLVLHGSSDKRVEDSNANGVSQSVVNASVLVSEPFNTSSSVIDFGKMNSNQCEKSEDPSSGPCLLGRTESSQILRGYPVTVSSNKGMNGVINGKKPALLPSMPKLESNSPRDGYLLQDYYLQKCSNDKKYNDTLSELQFLSHEEKKDHIRPQSRSLSDEVKPCRNNGNNVKLFGQILTHPASSHVEPNDDNGSEQQSRLNGSSFNLKFTGSHSADGNLPPAKVERHNYLAYDNNRPVRSYGFWDGNRIQTGFPSLPDSAVLLAKYPAAFGNYPLPSSVSSSNGVADYQVYRSGRDSSTKVQQPFTVDMNQRQDMVGIVRNGGILGGPCTGVSDPVAAIKLHYAKTENYNGQSGGTGGVIREQQESWRGNGDIGR